MRERIHIDELPFRVAICRQLPAEHTAGIDAIGGIHRLHFKLRDMSVNNGGLSPIFRRPVEPDRKPIFVGLSCGLAVKAEIPDLHRSATNVLLFQPGMGNDQLSVIQHIMAYKAVKEISDFISERFIFFFEFFHGLIKAVRELNVLAKKVFDELYIMVSGHRKAYYAF